MPGLPPSGLKVDSIASLKRRDFMKESGVDTSSPTKDQTEKALRDLSETGFKIRGNDLQEIARKDGTSTNGGRKRKQTRSKPPKKSKRKTRRAKRSSY